MTLDRRRMSLLALSLATALVTPPIVAQSQTETVRRVMVWRGADDQTFEITENFGARTYLGVATIDLNHQLREHFGAPHDHGVMVSSVLEDSPAERAGLAVADIVTAISNEPVSSSLGFALAITRREPGTEVEITFVRDGAELSGSAVLEEGERGRFDLAPLVAHRLPVGSEKLVRIRPGEGPEESLEGHQIKEVVINLRDQLESPLVLHQLEGIRSDRGELYAKLKLMEQRLIELEAEIERLNRER